MVKPRSIESRLRPMSAFPITPMSRSLDHPIFLWPSADVSQPDPHPPISLLLKTKAKPHFDRTVTDRSKSLFRLIRPLNHVVSASALAGCQLLAAAAGYTANIKRITIESSAIQCECKANLVRFGPNFCPSPCSGCPILCGPRTRFTHPTNYGRKGWVYKISNPPF